MCTQMERTFHSRLTQRMCKLHLFFHAKIFFWDNLSVKDEGGFKMLQKKVLQALVNLFAYFHFCFYENPNLNFQSWFLITISCFFLWCNKWYMDLWWNFQNTHHYWQSGVMIQRSEEVPPVDVLAGSSFGCLILPLLIAFSLYLPPSLSHILNFIFSEEKTQRCRSVVFVWKTLATTPVWLKTP